MAENTPPPTFATVFRIVWYAWVSFVLIDLAFAAVGAVLYAAWLYSVLPLVMVVIAVVCVIGFLFSNLS